ncbi:MAG: hypothetical protein ABL912_01745 [Novosphingobium sp.]
MGDAEDLVGALEQERDDLEREVARLTEERDDVRESLFKERGDRARTLAALRGLVKHLSQCPIRDAYQHAVDLVERGGM